MTQKELNYVEDAVSHENILIKVLKETCSNLDADLKDFFQNEITIHENMKVNLMNLLEDKINE